MSQLDYLKQVKDQKVKEKNELLKKKFDAEDTLNQLKRDTLSYSSYDDFYYSGKHNYSEEQRLKKRLKYLDNEIAKINRDLMELNNQIESEEIREINHDFLIKRNLSNQNIKQLKDKSHDISIRFESLIKEYSRFLKKINSVLNELEGYDVSNLKLLKLKIESKKQDLLNNQERCIEFELLNDLITMAEDNENYLKKAKSNLEKSKNLSKEFDLIVTNYSIFYSDLDKFNKEFESNDLKQLKNEINNKKLRLLEYQKKCFEFDRFDCLCEVIDAANKDLEDFKVNFETYKNLSNDFTKVIESYYRFSSNINSNLDEIDKKYDSDDLKQLKIDLKTKIDDLLILQRKCFNFNFVEELLEVVVDAKKELTQMRVDFRQSFERSKNLSIKFDSLIDEYSRFLSIIDLNLAENDYEDGKDKLKVVVGEIEVKIEDLSNYNMQCFKFDYFNELTEVLYNESKELDDIVYNVYHEKIEEYGQAELKLKSKITDSEEIYSKLSSKLTRMIKNTNKFGIYIDKKDLLDNLNEIKVSLNEEFKNLKHIKNILKSKNFNRFRDVPLIGDRDINALNNLFNELNFEDFEKIIDEQEEVYNNLSNLNKNINSEDVEKLLDEFERCYNRPIFKRQLRKYNLNNNELDLIEEAIKSDIINKVIIGNYIDFKKIIKIRCSEFRKNNSELDENKINNLLNDISFLGVDEDIVNECKNKVKNDFLEGNITFNQAEFKLKSHVTKKNNETNQLEELERIKNNPNVPSNKIHLTQEETNEIYIITKREILSKYGINDTIENRINFHVNKKIRENHSEARGRLNIIKRDFSNLTHLNNEQQIEFVNQIEYCIYNHQIKYYEITEEYIIKLSEDFINNGEIKLG